MKARLAAFRYAFSGLWYVVRTQRNAWFHAVASALVILLAAALQLPRRDWAMLLLAIGLVWMAELANTGLEALVDLISPEEHPLARIGKDVGAASVLIAAVTSAAIGIIILGPPLLTYLLGD